MTDPLTYLDEVDARAATADELRDLDNPYPGWTTEQLVTARNALRDLAASLHERKNT